jgi:hypothetical protein
MTRVVVATTNWSRRPEFGGLSWVPLQYVLGLRDLGVAAFWIDHLKGVDPFRKDHTVDYLRARFHDLTRSFGLEAVSGIVYDHGRAHFGLPADALRRLANEADLLLTLGKPPPTSTPLLTIARRAYVDIDPGFTQVWAQQRDIGLGPYDYFFTVGQNVGSPEFPIDTGEVSWRPILPPVHLPSWPARIDDRCRRFSTVADWRGSQTAELDGVCYGTKRSEFIRFLQVPLQTGSRIDLALCIGQQDHVDLGLLTGHEWRVRDPYQYAGDAFSYREFVQRSRGEFGVAKHGYVRSDSGWFSDRTACYLASGKPALVQSTGFEERVPTGEGLLTFSDPPGAVAALREVEEDYLRHCHAGRAFAERHLDAGRILTGLLEHVGLAPGEGGVTRAEGQAR